MTGRRTLGVLIAVAAGRHRPSRELGVTEYETRRLLERARPAAVALDTAAVPAALSASSGASS